MKNSSNDRKRLDEIFEINRRFLDLIAGQAEDSKERYGLPADVCLQVAALSPSERDSVATVPLLLVTATRRAVARTRLVQDKEDADCRTYSRRQVAEQNFTAALMIWLTQEAQQNHSLSSLWLGAPGFEGEPIRDLGFSDIQSLSPHAGTILKARFRNRPRVWQDLIRGARSKDSRRRQLARLALLPHSYPLRGKGRFGAWRKPPG